jgi:hypothetical protein
LDPTLLQDAAYFKDHTADNAAWNTAEACYLAARAYLMAENPSDYYIMFYKHRGKTEPTLSSGSIKDPIHFGASHPDMLKQVQHLPQGEFVVVGRLLWICWGRLMRRILSG